MALKELGLSLPQVRRLIDGITLDELHGMLMLRRVQLEHEIDQHRSQLLGIEARLRSIAREDGMPADDIVAKTIPATGVVAIAGRSAGWATASIVAVVNQVEAKFDELGIFDRVKEAGPRVLFYEEDGEDVMVFLGLPVADPPGDLPAPAQYRVLPEIEAAAAVRSGPAATIFPMVYHDLVRWIEERGYRPAGPNRNVWLHEIDDVADADQQVFEIQLPFTRPEADGES